MFLILHTEKKAAVAASAAAAAATADSKSDSKDVKSPPSSGSGSGAAVTPGSNKSSTTEEVDVIRYVKDEFGKKVLVTPAKASTQVYMASLFTSRDAVRLSPPHPVWGCVHPPLWTVLCSSPPPLFVVLFCFCSVSLCVSHCTHITSVSVMPWHAIGRRHSRTSNRSHIG